MASGGSQDYGSVFNANHINTPSQARFLQHHRYLAENATSIPFFRNPHSQELRTVSSDEPYASTLEFRVPLLAGGPSFSEFQSHGPLLQSAAYSLPWAHWYETATGFTREKGLFVQAPVYATVSIPLPGPSTAASSAASVPTLLEQAPSTRAATLADSTSISALPISRLEDEVIKVESAPLSLHDICHVESSASGFDSLALPPPIYAKHSPDLLAPRATSLENVEAYAECSSADYMTPTWTSVSSIPSLSHDSFSGSENNVLRAPSSSKMSISEFLRSSPSPALGSLMDERASASSPLVGLYVDVNMRELALRSKSPPVCVNPADIMTDSLMYPSPTMDSSPVVDIKQGPVPNSACGMSTAAERSMTPPPRSGISPTPDCSADFPQEAVVDEEFPDEAISAIVSILKTSAVKPEPHPTPLISTGVVNPRQIILKENEVVAPQPLYPLRGQIYPGNDLGMLRHSLGDPKALGPSTHSHKRIPLADLPIPQAIYTGPPHVHHSFGAYQPATTYAFAPPPPPPQALPMVPTPALGPPPSPVLNAHAGIVLEELRRRADDYRARHEGADLDKNFLQCFAGRLSARGEMLDEYRCYVAGCEQRNKRRDHILVHVGAHVEHRPWMCRHCGMRFLRKNECKRHEVGHEGRKPFSCPLCASYQEKSFVRQDLLKRHLRIAHGAQGAVARKKKNVKDENEDYWP